jgi:carboxyl-terminal processing protease
MANPRFPRTVLTLGVGVLLGVAIAVTGPVLARRAAGSDAASLATAEMARLSDLIDRVRREYVAEVDSAQLMDNALRGVVSGLDEYSEYLDADQYADMQASTRGHYTGIGVEVAATQRGLEVLRPLADSPASRAGLRRGDLIVRIDGRAVADDADEAIERMRGPSGSQVRLSVHRDEPRETLDLAVERADVDLRSAEGLMLEPGFAYLRVSAFNENTGEELDAELRRLSDPGAAGEPLRGIVLDLRNNPGGVLEAAVEVADQFLDSGVIVTAMGRTDEARFRLEATPGELAAGTRMAVLVNGGSASAAEIVAGALQDHSRALVVGRRTYGKGSVQTVIPLDDGRALKLTTSHYATPSGVAIDGRGVEPDVTLAGPDEIDGDARRDTEVAAALDALRGSRRGEIARR